MSPEGDMWNRINARNDIQDFFRRKREALRSGTSGPLETRVQNQFLKEMTELSRDWEMEAMKLADQGKDWVSALEDAERDFEDLKARFLKNLNVDDPVLSKPYEGIIETIKNL